MKVILLDVKPPRPVASCELTGPGSSLLIPSPRRPRVLPYAISAILHGCIGLVVFATTESAPPAKPTSATYAAKAIMIRMPQQVFMPKLQQKELSDAAPATERLIERATALLSQPRKEQASITQPTPTMAGDARAQQILMQPQYPLDLQPPPLAPAVPSVLVWSAQTPARIQRELPSTQMQEPMAELRLGARIVDVPESVRLNATLLPIASPPVNPVKQPQTTASPDSHSVAVLSVSDAPVTSQTLVIPPGNVIPKSAADDTGGSSNVTEEMIHAANGRFNVVVIQSSADETLPTGFLTGKPVYTVYLPVGDSKEWIMHFSAGNSSVVQRGGFVQLPDPRPLNAPYPSVTVRPTVALSAPGPYLLVRGSIDESGTFQNLQLLGPVQTGASALLEALSRWRFRPATRADSPEKIQMVLAIPLHKI